MSAKRKHPYVKGMNVDRMDLRRLREHPTFPECAKKEEFPECPSYEEAIKAKKEQIVLEICRLCPWLKKQ